jgi:tRNA(Ile)-lysidine synthase
VAPPAPPLTERFRERLAELGLAGRPSRVLVACSGGCDSTVLLHLLRFHATDLPIEVHAAHLDHRMRAGSETDRLWLRGLCRAWGVPLREGVAEPAPAGESAARAARYDFLRESASEVAADFILTAHHADDQAETVLFRVLRGTGIEGLRGIRDRPDDGLLRPLLPFWRREIEAYAAGAHLRWRRDPTNTGDAYARNRLRARIIPQVEESVAPGARRALVGLARMAEETERALRRLTDAAEREIVERDGEAYLLARTPLARYDSATTSRLLRRLLRRFGTVPDRAGTRSALQFITDASSGRVFPLPGGLLLSVEFDRVRLARVEDEEEDLPLTIPTLQPEVEWSGEARIGGRTLAVQARLHGAGVEPPPGVVAVPVGASSFPLRLRGWAPGDRMRTAAGTRSLKKLFLERRVPRAERHRRAVLLDPEGSVLWAAGIGHARDDAAEPGGPTLHLTITND